MPQTIFTDSNFENEVKNSQSLVLVYFWAEKCDSCETTKKVFEKLIEEYDSSKIKIGKLNVDDNQVVATQCNILSIPTFLLFRNGQMIDKCIGDVPEERLKQMICKEILL